ncbi:hypothetical protein CC86DRAFT_411326 [Ophiobolus disseminans]|uniref:Uncharacterized protein n=1 Tax=Ophiobolus disseminans TaxID=1469910 RepID=A0A6A6ZJ10_9PLEO|nr:hypothetical protein CC86DRAFT_411326 [Ophiobolus disseminans]
MPAPLAKGIIIAASIVVAAGIAIYESPQVRAWVDQSRRKIAVALHSLGDDIQPRRPSESTDDFEYRKQRREELVRRNRNELIRRAREEGVAVDLDELAKIGSENVESAQRRSTADRTRSFDTMVGSDGTLRNNTKSTGNDASDNGARKRGAAGFAAGATVAATMSNPFSDENVLFDVGDGDDDEAPSPKEFTYVEPPTRESSATIEAASPPPAATDDLIDLTAEPSFVEPKTHDETDQAAQSFYSFTSSASHSQDPLAQTRFFDNNEVEHMSAGTLTPRSDRSHSIVTGASVAGSNADDIGILSMQNDTDHDARSEVFSEGGFTDAGFSEAGFSELGNDDRTGVMTPNSWTDVGSDDESDWGGAQGNGHVSQVHQ